jgi:hypothetical protein
LFQSLITLLLFAGKNQLPPPPPPAGFITKENFAGTNPIGYQETPQNIWAGVAKKENSSSSGNQTQEISLHFNCLSKWVVKFETKECGSIADRGKKIFFFFLQLPFCLRDSFKPNSG